MTEQILFLTKPEYTSLTSSTVRFKMPPLSMDRPKNIKIELLQGSIRQDSNDVERGGLDLRLKTVSPNYVSTDNNGVSLGLFKYLYYSGNVIYYDYNEANTYAVNLTGNPDYLEFEFYRMDDVLSPYYVVETKLILRITYEPLDETISQYIPSIPLPSRV